MTELVLELNGRTWALDPSRTYRLGRDPQGDIPVDDARVSWRHATLRWAGGWLLEDPGSTNGTYAQGARIGQLQLTPGTTVLLGNATDGVPLTFSGAGLPPQRAGGQEPAPSPIGRDGIMPAPSQPGGGYAPAPGGPGHPQPPAGYPAPHGAVAQPHAGYPPQAGAGASADGAQPFAGYPAQPPAGQAGPGHAATPPQAAGAQPAGQAPPAAPAGPGAPGRPAAGAPAASPAQAVPPHAAQPPAGQAGSAPGVPPQAAAGAPAGAPDAPPAGPAPQAGSAQAGFPAQAVPPHAAQPPAGQAGAVPGVAPQAPAGAPAGAPGGPPSGPAPQAGQPAAGGGGHAAAAPRQVGERPTTFHQLSLGRVMQIGRALENELVVSDLQVSRHHAEFRASPDGRLEIRDLGSHNGTYVNGQPLPKSGSALLTPQDTVGVGHSTFRVVGDRLEEFVDTGEVSFSASHLTVKVDGGKVILNDVTFGVPEKSLVAVIGPSGSGKSTLLRALTGYRPADVGEVLYDNRNLYTQFAELRQRIGLVPQDDILHKDLTVRTALRYAARLRFPGDVAQAERNARIEEVLAELKLDIHATKKITSLSGGQRKRVSVALELLTKPSLIFLDEPTSGLDPGMDRDVMQLLRGLADDGRTVLVVTHSVAELRLCDKLLVMAPGGGVAYFGPPEEALHFFGYDSWADVFSAFENYRDYDWMGRWQGSQHYQTYAADAAGATAQQPPYAAPQVPGRLQKPQSWGSQLWTLIRRYVSVIASDRGFLALMLVLPAILGVVSVVIPSDYGLGRPEPGHFNQDAGIIMMILAVGMCFSGAANSVRELIKERVIYERERATGLSRSAYLMSKVIVLGLITAMQGVIICAIGFSTRTLPAEGLLMPPAVELCVAIIALGFTSMMFGLVISALVRTAEKTMPLLVMFAIVQVVFTGVLFKVFGSPGVSQVAWLMPSRWAIGASGATLDLAHLMAPWDHDKPADLDPLWEHSVGVWSLDMAVLLALGLICTFAVARLLRRHEPEVMRK